MWGVTQWESFDVIDSSAGQPLADFTCVAADAGMVTQFTNTSLNNGPLTEYQWDVDGDGVIDYTTENVSHTYTTPGL